MYNSRAGCGPVWADTSTLLHGLCALVDFYRALNDGIPGRITPEKFAHWMAYTPIALHKMTVARPAIIVVMGVCGTGKSTLGNAIANALDIPFIDGDDLHPPSNIEKMSAGTPLNDDDRMPWLAIIREKGEQETSKGGAVIACSSLRKSYREVLRGLSSTQTASSDTPTYFVFIKGSRELLLDRMSKRQGHFMKVSMLDSQLETLESPEGETGVVVVPCEDSPEGQVRKALDGLKVLRET